MAPEVIKEEYYSLKVDIYSFGIIIWEVCTGKIPYETYSENFIKYSVLNGCRPSKDLLPENTPMEMIELMELCLNGDPNMRPDSEDIVKYLEIYLINKNKN
jgi:serine/threonine protein kinase